MKASEILSQLPYAKPFLFVDEIIEISENGVEGAFTFKENMDFYQGHFANFPVTPGVILTECCAQLGLACQGIYLASTLKARLQDAKLAMASADMEFFLPVYPGEKVIVRSEKLYFRFNKLKCSVKMFNSSNQLVCKGVLSGMLKLEKNA